MAGTLIANTINTDTGVFSTNNAYSGIAKAWVNFVGSTGVINASFNVSSVTRASTGIYTINYTTAMPSANYVVCGVTSQSNTIVTMNDVAPTTGSANIATRYCSSATVTDSPITTFAAFGA